MMTPDMMAEEISRWFSMCRRQRRLSIPDLASQAGCDAEFVDRIEKADFDACFALRERYTDRSSVERRLCDLVGLSPKLCAVLDEGVIF